LSFLPDQAGRRTYTKLEMRPAFPWKIFEHSCRARLITNRARGKACANRHCRLNDHPRETEVFKKECLARPLAATPVDHGYGCFVKKRYLTKAGEDIAEDANISGVPLATKAE
jgi:hypothetical protein